MKNNKENCTGSYPKCFQCGYCCTVSSCGYGRYDPIKKQCSSLTKDNKCAKYQEIIDEEDKWRIPHMFGAGCSSSLFNERRDAKMKKLGVDIKAERSTLLAFL